VRITPPGSGGKHAIRTSTGRIIVPVYIGIGQRRTGSNDVTPPAAGMLVHSEWLRTSAHYLDPGFSCS